MEKSISLQSASKPRLSPKEYLALCTTHFKANWKYYVLPVAGVLLLQTIVRLDVNYTESLPDHVFLTIKGWKTGLKAGDYVAYRFPTENPYSPFRKGDHMVKIIGGVEGDVVQMSSDRYFTILEAGKPSASASIPGGKGTHGKAKERSMRGYPLEAGPVGIIPKDAFYVFAPHPDSLDSRYAMVGWITKEDIIGRTFPIF